MWSLPMPDQVNNSPNPALCKPSQAPMHARTHACMHVWEATESTDRRAAVGNLALNMGKTLIST